MVANLKESENTLYEQDFYLWLENTTQLLRNSNFQELDIPNLIEEIEAIGRSEKRAFYSNLKILLQAAFTQIHISTRKTFKKLESDH